MTSPFATLSAIGFLICSSTTSDVEVTHFRAPDGPRVAHVSAIHRAPDGSLWVGTRGGGVSHLDGNGWTHISEKELGMASVASIFSEGEDVLWFAGQGGVTRFDGSKWKHFGAELGREIRVAFSGFVDTDGAVWFGTNAGAVRFDGREWKWTTTENGLEHDVVHDLLRDRSENLWFGTRRGGLSRLNGQGEWAHFHARDNIRSIHEDAQGNLWFGTGGGGVHQFDGTKWTRHHAGETILPLFDSRGNVWFSRGKGGGLRYREGNWTLHTEHLPSAEITTGVAGPSRVRWFGSTSGLRRLQKVK